MNTAKSHSIAGMPGSAEPDRSAGLSRSSGLRRQAGLRRLAGLRSVPKRIAFALAWLLVSPLIALAGCERHFGSGESLFTGIAQGLALLPGRLGVMIRAAFYRGTLDQCHWENHVGFGSLFSHRGARIGPHVSMGAYCVIGQVAIGERVIMGSRVSIPSGRRQHLDAAGGFSARAQFETVTVGAGSWIGEGAIILADVGAGCVVAAGAVVCRAHGAHCVLAGNPASPIRSIAPQSHAPEG